MSTKTKKGKTVTKKPAAKKAAPAKKPVVKKPMAKKSVAKKPATKKSAGKKPAAKKPTAKKPVAKKPQAKKAVVNPAGLSAVAAGPISFKGILAIDTDGIGDHHGDATAQNRTSAKVDANGKFVPADSPAGVRFLNADTQAYSVAPKNFVSTIKVGDTATVTLPNGKTFSAPVGDYGPDNKAGEFSLKAVQSMGVDVIFTKNGPIPTLDGKAASDIKVSVTFFPGSAK